MIRFLSFEAGDEPVKASPLVLQYDLLRRLLAELSSAPERDAAAIADVLAQLDQSHAALKAHYSALTPARYRLP